VLGPRPIGYGGWVAGKLGAELPGGCARALLPTRIHNLRSHSRNFNLISFCYSQGSQYEEMSSLSLFHGRSDGNIEGCVGTILARSWYMADGPPSHVDLGVRFDWLSSLHSDGKRVRAAALHAAYYQCRSEIMDNKAILEALEQQHYKLQCSVTPIHSLPPEIVMEIFRIAHDNGEQRNGLMLVCHRWCTIIEGMADIWASLDLGAETEPERLKQLLSRAGTYPLAVKINIGKAVIMTHKLVVSLATAACKAPQWETLTICSLPQEGQDVPFYYARISAELLPMTQLKHLNIKEPVSSSLLELFLENVITGAVGNLTSMGIHSSSAIQYLLQPAHASIFGTLTTFTAKIPKMTHPVDLFPHFRQLEVLNLTSVLLPLYDGSSAFPVIHTLHHLHLRAVSIRWLGGQDFPHLETCVIIAPMISSSLERDVRLPVCTKLHFENRDISPVRQFCVPTLDYLSVKSNAWSSARGNGWVAQLCMAGLGTRLQPRVLSLSIVCSDMVLLAALQLLPCLEELKLDLARPSALGKRFFTGLLAKPSTYQTGKLQPAWRALYKDEATGWGCTVCPSLKVLELKYQRWLRPGDDHEFFPTLIALSWSREKTVTPLQCHISLKSSLDFQVFVLDSPAAELLSCLMIPGHDQVTHLSLETETWKSDVYETPVFTPFVHHLQVLKIHAKERQNARWNLLPTFQKLRELKLSNVLVLPPAHNVDLPLVHTLRTLSLWNSNIAWMEGLVFAQLERFEMNEHGWPETLKHKVVMPACTHIKFTQGELKILPVLRSNFHFPLLETWELNNYWQDNTYSRKGLRALQMIHAKVFHFRVFLQYHGLLELLESKDEVEQLQLKFIDGTVSHGALEGLSVINHHTTKILCPNLKALRLQFRLVEDEKSKGGIIQQCMHMLALRKLAGHPLEKCSIWWHYNDWENSASMVMVT